MGDATIEVCPESKIEGLDPHNQRFFNPDFSDQKSLRTIVERHGQVLFQPFDQKGFRVDSLHLEIDPIATFRLHPCRFIRRDIMGPLKVLMDQFVSERVLIPDISCSHASPLSCIRRKGYKDGWQWIINSYGYRLINYHIKICFFSS